MSTSEPGKCPFPHHSEFNDSQNAGSSSHTVNSGKCPVIHMPIQEQTNLCNELVAKIFEFRHTSSTRQKTNPLGEDFNYAEEFKN